MTVLNNVNVSALEQTIKEAKTDKSKARRTQCIEGKWRVEEGGPQFQATVTFEGGKIILASDQPKSLGGGGTLPGPMHYCFFGLAACYTTTFATVASQMGIKLEKLDAKLGGDLNFSRVFALSDKPVMERVRLTLQVSSDAPEEKLQEAEKLAYERCPAVFALTEKVRLDTLLEVNK